MVLIGCASWTYGAGRIAQGKTMERKPQKASGLLGRGITSLVLGQIACPAGQRQAIEASLSTSVWDTPED